MWTHSHSMRGSTWRQEGKSPVLRMKYFWNLNESVMPSTCCLEEKQARRTAGPWLRGYGLPHALWSEALPEDWMQEDIRLRPISLDELCWKQDTVHNND